MSTTRKYKDLTGQRFGKWVVLKDLGTRHTSETVDNRTHKPVHITQRFYLCECDCGNRKEIVSGNLSTGKTKSCSSCRVAFRKEQGSHWSKHPLWGSWQAMIHRCTNPNDISYKNYGGRGIKVCDRWLNSFENFCNDMGDKPSPKHTLDRINNNGNYVPNNCRWATTEQQANNKRPRYENELTAPKLALATGFSRERIRQLSFLKHRPLKRFLIPVVSNRRTRYIFKEEAIDFIKNGLHRKNLINN